MSDCPVENCSAVQDVKDSFANGVEEIKEDFMAQHPGIIKMAKTSKEDTEILREYMSNGDTHGS